MLRNVKLETHNGKKERKKVRKHHKMVNIKGETKGGLGFWSKEERDVVQAKEVGGEGGILSSLPFEATAIIYDFYCCYGQRKNLKSKVKSAEISRAYVNYTESFVEIKAESSRRSVFFLFGG